MSFLSQPYPFEVNSRKAILGHLIVAGFIAAFLIIFQPFGIWEWKHPHKVLHLMMFGLTGFLVSCPLTLLFQTMFVNLDANWKVWKEILFVLGGAFFFIMGNYAYAILIRVNEFSISSFLSVCLFGFFLGLFPITANVYFIYKKASDRYKKDAAEINPILEQLSPMISDQKDMVYFTAENGKDTFTIPAGQLLYIQSTDNYCEIIYQSDTGLKKTLFRSSLKGLENQHDLSYLLRCHRSYIVNLKQVRHIEGNAQGYTICFDQSPHTVSVSRKYASRILEELKGQKRDMLNLQG